LARRFDLITFDFDGVLLHNNFHDLFLAQCREMGLQWLDGVERKLARYVHDYYGSGQSVADVRAHGMSGFWQVANRRFLEVLGVQEDCETHALALTEKLQAAEVIYFHETGIHDMLASLRGEGYRLVMLTNRDERVREFGEEWGFIEPFEFIATRETVGKPKPEPDVFRHISALVEISPERSLHVGDNPYADVMGARAAGWHSILIDPDDLFDDWDVPRVPSILELPEWLRGERSSAARSNDGEQPE
jgi:HAD superfamily hydrolase (TIGR01549 family)